MSPRTTSSIGTQLAELKGSDTVANDFFGMSVAISGTTSVVGAPGYATDGGRAYVFTKTGNTWKQAAELKGSDTTDKSTFGNVVAISGSTVVVGDSGDTSLAGGMYIFTKTAAGWEQTAALSITPSSGSLAISGTTIFVGEPRGAGRVYVFTKIGTVWKQVAVLKSFVSGQDGFGESIAVSGTTLVVMATDQAKGLGRVDVFNKTGILWKPAAILKTSDTVLDACGCSVAISGTTVVFGASGQQAVPGRAYVFTKTGAIWKQVAELKGSDETAVDEFGWSVAISGTTAVVGAEIHSAVAGRAYVFTKTATGWVQVAELKGSDTVAGATFGYSVAISGTAAIVGAYNSHTHAGRAYLFEA
jgi:hypothetical protein